MVHFAQLLLTPPPAPDAVQQALYLGAAAKKIAGHALLESSKGTAWQRLTWQTGPSLERATHKLQASLQLAKAHQTLAAAHQLAGSGAQQVAALRKGLQVGGCWGGGVQLLLVQIAGMVYTNCPADAEGTLLM
jgi:hypothetical protein